MNTITQCIANIPNAARLKSLNIQWHQPGVHTSVNTLLLIGIIVAGIVAVAALIAYANK